MGKRFAIFAALAWIAGLAAFAAAAEDYPNRPIRVVVGFSAGSGADITARVVGQRMGQLLGQQIVVENKTGAGSSLAAEFVARAPKDGYTLLLATIANPINAAMSSNLSFDFPKDFVPIVRLTTTPNILVVHPSVGVKSVKELIDLAKSKPDQLSFASSGVATGTHLSGELFKVLAGVKMVHVPYAGSPQAVTDLLAGRIQLFFSPASTVLQHVRDGKLVALASTEAKRTAIAPELPTMVEAGLPGFETGLWFGLLAPAGTPKEVVDKLARAANEALQTDEVAKALAPQGIDLVGGSPEDFARYLDGEMKRWADGRRGRRPEEITRLAHQPVRLDISGGQKMDRGKRRTIALALALAAQLALPCAQAEDYPARPVRIIVGFIPGSSADITARVLGQRMGQILGQQFVVENKPGAGSSLAAEFVARAPKDGYTLFLASSANITNAAINPNLSFDLAKDFAPIALVTTAADHPRGSPRDRGEQRAGADRAREVEAGRSVLRLDRGRHRPASLRRALRHAQRNQARARSLPGQPASGDRSPCRPHLDDVLAGIRRGLASRNRQAQGARLGRRRSVPPSPPTCRPWPKPGCPTSTPASGSASWRRRERRARSWTSSPARRARHCSRRTC